MGQGAKFNREGKRRIGLDEKITPGEAVSLYYSPGNLLGYLGKVISGDEKLLSPVHITGSFNLSIRVNADGKTITVAVYDSKTISSLSDKNLDSKSNQKRNNSDPRPFTTQYIRFIWNQSLTE